MADTWGNTTWGINEWGEQNSLSVNVTGIALTPSIGNESVVAELNSGWGRLEWGNLAWGAGYSVITSGTSLSSSIGTATSTAETIVTLTGQSLTSVIGNEAVGIGINVDVTGISLSANIGAIAGITIQGTAASMGIGPVDIQVDGSISINVTEHTMQTAIGSPSIEIAVGPVLNTAGLLQTAVGSAIADANTLAAVTGISLTGSLGNVDPVSIVDVAGIAMTASIGEELPVADVTVATTTAGLLQTSIGTVDAVSSVELVGLPATVLIGSATTAQTANVFVTGISLTGSLGNVAVTPWVEVDLDVNNTWTEVDLAA
tara:strand:+ start:199 stop:1146 length:948 start_codon:yes stop_codon:yes gene_type:complete